MSTMTSRLARTSLQYATRIRCIQHPTRSTLLLQTRDVQPLHRYLSSSSSSSSSPDEKLNNLDNNNKTDEPGHDPDHYSPFRHLGIVMNPESISSQIMPGNLVYKESMQKSQGQSYIKRDKRYTELVYGYFWMLKDLTLANNKPILASTITSDDALDFPILRNLQRLSNSEKVDLPSYFVRDNRLADPTAQCTLVTVSFRDFGYKMLPTWTEPYLQQNSDRIKLVRLNIVEGYVNTWLLGFIVKAMVKHNTPKAERDSTLLYLSKNAEEFRDALRMHNVMTGYVFLLDGLGRVRFAGSGEATSDEIDSLVNVTKQILTAPVKKATIGKRPLRPSSSSKPSSNKSWLKRK